MEERKSQNEVLELLTKQTRLLEDILQLQRSLLEDQHRKPEQGYSRGPRWEYAEISMSKTTFSNPAYIWVYRNGQLDRVKGIEGKNKVLVALESMGKQGFELVTAVTGIGDWGPETLRLFLKRPRHYREEPRPLLHRRIARKICPTCKHANDPALALCARCGTKLEPPSEAASDGTWS